MNSANISSVIKVVLALSAISAGPSLIAQVTIVAPARGGGLDTSAPMVHADLYFDTANKKLEAILGTSAAHPKLVALPDGYSFDDSTKYRVLSGKAYNFQYAWAATNYANVVPPVGAAIWVECVDSTPGLETYDGPGSKMETPPRPYTPIFGTGGSPRLWKWYNRMAHNAYAIRNPATNVITATYKVFFGDVETGSRERFADYSEASMTLVWDTADPVFVTPYLGGGQVQGAGMIHIDVAYDEANKRINAIVDETMGIPRLVPVAAGHAFDPAQKYAVLNQRSHNSQYGWNPFGYITLPNGAAIWVEQTRATPGLEIYEGNSKGGSYTPIFGTAGSAKTWKWSGSMVHNTYGVVNPCRDLYEAEYRVYLADAQTGDPSAFAEVTPAIVKLSWNTAPAAFVPVLQLSRLQLLPGCARAQFTGEPWGRFYLERSPVLGALTDWKRVAGPFISENIVQAVEDTNCTPPGGFYRIAVEDVMRN